MPDPRFYEALGPVTLAELAALTGGALADPADAQRSVDQVAVLAGADARCITYFAGARHRDALTATAAGACLVVQADAHACPEGCAAMVVAMPNAANAQVAERLHKARRHELGAGAVDPSAQLEDGVILAPGVVIGPGASIGRGTRVCSGAVIGPGVAIGRDSFVGANVSIGFALIGDNVRIWAGAVIGEAGFGATAGPRGVIDMPQLGRVILQDGVTVGANSCIDRGAYEDTVVGGRNCVIAAHTGISGSVTIGDGAQLGGRVGIADHVHIGAGARLAAGAGFMRDVPAGESWGGFPAQPVRRWMREVALLSRLATRRGGGEGH